MPHTSLSAHCVLYASSHRSRFSSFPRRPEPRTEHCRFAGVPCSLLLAFSVRPEGNRRGAEGAFVRVGLLQARVSWVPASAGTTNCVVVIGGPVDGLSFLGSGPVSSTGQALRRNDGRGLCHTLPYLRIASSYASSHRSCFSSFRRRPEPRTERCRVPGVPCSPLLAFSVRPEGNRRGAEKARLPSMGCLLMAWVSWVPACAGTTALGGPPHPDPLPPGERGYSIRRPTKGQGVY